MEGKKIGLVVVLIVVTVLAVGITVKRNVAGEKPPDYVLEREYEKIDMVTIEPMTLTMAEWAKLGKQGGKYKNPDTGEFTMVNAMVCHACGEKIPVPDLPAGAEMQGAGALDQIHAEYMCPKCKEHAFPAPAE